jgi:DNA polymerase (family X)
MEPRDIDNSTIAAHFRLLGDLMELHGEGGFKSAAYTNAYRTLKNFDIPLVDLSIPELEEIPGIGKAIAAKIFDLAQHNTFPLLEKYLSLTPPGVVEMLQLKGIGPKKIAQLWQELGVESIGELYYACLENRLTLLKGFGEKTQANLVQQIEFIQQSKGQLLYARAEPLALSMLHALQTQYPNQYFELTGAVRRKETTLSAIEILTDLPESNWTEATELLGGTISDGSAVLENGLSLNFFPVERNSPVLSLFSTTGVPAHVEQVLKKTSNLPIAPDSELAIYEAAGMPFVPPELRQDVAEWKWMDNGATPLLIEKDIRGILHAHSTYSDGSFSLEEMAKYCLNKGWEYLGITDHSQSAFYADGLKESDIRRQHEEIDRLNSQLAPFRIFKGIESDILTDGRLDYPDEILRSFDFVIASVHSHLKMDEEKATIRLMKAIEHPATTILGHATGRLLLSRPGYPIDTKKIIDACAANGVAIELNANPFRLDIDWTWIPYCMEKGVPVAINPDAHNLAGMHDIRYGVAAARKGGLVAAACLSSLGVSELAHYFKKRRS